MSFADLKCCCYHLSSQNRPKRRMSSAVHWIAPVPEVLTNTVEMCGQFGCVGSTGRQDSWPASGAVDSKQWGSGRSWASVVMAKASITESDSTLLDSASARPVLGLNPREHPGVSCQPGSAADTSSWECGLGSPVWSALWLLMCWLLFISVFAPFWMMLQLVFCWLQSSLVFSFQGGQECWLPYRVAELIQRYDE